MDSTVFSSSGISWAEARSSAVVRMMIARVLLDWDNRFTGVGEGNEWFFPGSLGSVGLE